VPIPLANLSGSTADKMNYLQPVSSVKYSLGPPRARNNLSIMLNRYPVTLQPKFPNELLKAGTLRERIKCAGLAVKNQRE
jgi:hypothetical protein